MKRFLIIICLMASAVTIASAQQQNAVQSQQTAAQQQQQTAAQSQQTAAQQQQTAAQSQQQTAAQQQQQTAAQGQQTAMQQQDEINFDDFFVNKTLRLDYVFSGDHHHQSIAVDELASLPLWAGRRHNLDKVPLKGDGQIVVADSASQKIIYKMSFASLFMEYVDTKEAATKTRAFQNTFLVPFPKQPVKVTITIYNKRNQPTSTLTQFINPKDILIHKKGESHITPHKYIVESGSPEKCIDVAIIAEGYTKGEMDIFYRDAKIATDSIFNSEPYKSNKSKFNVVAVASESIDSGVSLPRAGSWKNTCVGANSDTFYTDRYMAIMNIKAMHDLLAGIPYEHIIVLANSEVYGGGGIYNEYILSTTHHPKLVLVHEFSHSFAGLADEYFLPNDVFSDTYPADVEPWEPNITTRVNFTGKWEKLIPAGVELPTVVEQVPVEISGATEAEKIAAGLQTKFSGPFVPKSIIRLTVKDYGNGTEAGNVASGKKAAGKNTANMKAAGKNAAGAGKKPRTKIFEQYASSENGFITANITHFGNNKLKHPGTLPAGLYEGGGYSSKGIYRCWYDCRMRSNQYPLFCPACYQAIQNMIDFYYK